MSAKAIITYAGPVKAGNEWRENRRNARVLHSYLSERTDVSSEMLYCKGPKFEANFFDKLRTTFKQNQPALIAFFGHGDRSAITTYKNERLGFFNFARSLTLATAPTLVIIDACESYGLANKCREQGVDPSIVGVISACSAKEFTGGGWLVPHILKRWEKQRNFPKIKTPADCMEDDYTEDGSRPLRDSRGNVPKKHCYQTVRWGARPDHIFFPSG